MKFLQIVFLLILANAGNLKAQQFYNTKICQRVTLNKTSDSKQTLNFIISLNDNDFHLISEPQYLINGISEIRLLNKNHRPVCRFKRSHLTKYEQNEKAWEIEISDIYRDCFNDARWSRGGELLIELCYLTPIFYLSVDY